ncbi:MAG: deoxyribodipyrimidine photo-lyase [Wenzhouxiangellaceae bacterium]|nr:deoxyribodipyrimidine photo-lyase [Wenzhouxiangellaceae bacterium]
MNDLAIVWFRRDFRLADNPALDHACERHAQVLPVYIHDVEAEGDWAPGAASRWWLHHALIDLDLRLRERGSRLLIRAGAARELLTRLVAETGAAAVYWNRLYEPSLVARDRQIKQQLRDADVHAQSFRAAALFEPWELLKDDQQPYRVFTPFWKRMQRDWRAVSHCPEPRQLPPAPKGPASASVQDLGLLPDHDWPDTLAGHWTVGERAAKQRLGGFVECVADYDERRNRPDLNGTSRLSPDLHFGHLSPMQVVEALSPAGELPDGKGALAYVRELAWREFSMAMLFHEPRLSDEPLQPRFQAFPWRAADEYADDLARWQRGRTGVPLVDAGMRELWATGWMHNRVRMVVASWLTKNLLIPWQEGARWFWDTLVDADLANNTQGWQWTAGCGADAAPYFRVFNPELQAGKFDPEARYIQRWCPELAGLDHKALAKMDAHARRHCGYPSLQADLKRSRQRALDAFAEIRA